MRFLSPPVHAVLDYVVVAVFALAPLVLPLSEIPAALCWVVSAGQLLLSLLTAYAGGVATVLSFPTHGVIELLVGVAALVAPWALGFDGEPLARNFYLASGLVLGATWLVTDYEAAEHPPELKERRV